MPRKTPPHGTIARYRLELKSKTVCDRCRAANTKAKSRQRARAKQRGATPILSIVPDVQPERTDSAIDDLVDEDATPAGYQDVPAWGMTEKAVRSDLKDVPQDTPFFNSLRAAALMLAREIDSVDSRTSKAPLVKQLVDVIRELKGKEEQGGNSFADLLSIVSTPLVPGAAVLDGTEPG